MTDGKQPPSSPDLSAAKRMKMDEKKNLKDHTSDQFVSKIQYFSGPEVIIKIDQENYSLPKRLVCHYSTFFDRAFNGDFKEGQEQQIRLEEVTVPTFNMVIQWMYCCQVTLPPLPANKLESEAHQERLATLVDFFMCADRINLMGPFDTIIEQVKKILGSSHLNLSAAHIRKAASLPTGHAVRRLFAESCVRPFFYHLLPPQKCPNTKLGIFRFQKELDEVDVFAADLLKAYQEAMRSRIATSRKGYSNLDMVVPITGEIMESI